jgi:twitching motility protein PilT
MAAIDSLLSLIDAQQATGIVLRAREAPVMIGGKGRGLTIPPMSLLTLETFVSEVLSQDELATLSASGACDTAYRSGQAGTFSVEARRSADNLSLKLRRGAAGVTKPAGAAAQAPAPQAVGAPLAPFAPLAASAPPVSVGPVPPPAPLVTEPALVAGAAPASTSDPAQVALASRLAATLARAATHDVSDLILSSGQPLWIRTAAGFSASSANPIGELEIRAFVASILDGRRRQILESAGSVDAPWVAPEVDDEGAQRFRVNVFTQTHGLAVALRPINRRAPALADLGLPESIGALANVTGGMVLVVGATGAGKSTTLAALLERINRARASHVITLEDPIEFVYQPRRCLIHQREIGTHVESFAAGLRAALREAPDIILVGEMRDRETAALALTAAETGHLVLSTLHSGSAAMAIDRMVDIFPEHQQGQVQQQIAGSLRAVLTQQLLPGAAPATRCPAIELLTVNYAVAALIREGKTHQLATQIQTGREDGMITFESSLFDLLRAGRITRDTALGAARDSVELQRRLREARL